MVQQKVHQYSPLIVDLSQGSEQAFRTLFNLLGAKVYHYCKKRTGSAEDAEEMVQDIFLKLWKYREKIDPQVDIEPLLFTIARNHLWNTARKKVAFTVSLPSFNEDTLYTGNEESQLAIDYKETYRQYLAIMQKLSAQTRTVFEMSREQGLSNKEIAERLQLSVRTVETHISRALSVLRLEFKDALQLTVLYLFILS